MDNLGFQRNASFATISGAEEEVIQAHIDTVNAAANVVMPFSEWRSKFRKLWINYQWRMRHYFYIHLFVFFCNTLICGAIVWGIEEYKIPYVDCWFVSATCVFTCGLQTYDFALLSRSSQSVLLFFTWISGITVSTIPAIIIKIYRVKHEVIRSEEAARAVDNDILPIKRLVPNESIDSHVYDRIHSLPSPNRLRITAYILMIVLILSTCLVIYFISFLSMGIWLKYHYDPEDILQANQTMNPFYAAIVITITGFNQNGLSPWTGGIALLVNDVFMNIFIMFVVMSGTSLFPAIIRGVVNLCKLIVCWRYKIYFDYILLNNHRLSTVIFPSIQTRLYVTITVLLQILGVVVALILDYNNKNLAGYAGGTRFMIFMLETANTRFAGYATTDLSILASGTLIIFVLLMGVKPQMLCAINETPFEMEWMLIQTQQKLEDKVSSNTRRGSLQIFLPFNRMKHYLSRQGSLTKAQAKKYYSSIARSTQADLAVDQLNEARMQHRMSILSLDMYDASKENQNFNARISFLRMKLLLIIFCRHAVISLFSLLISTRTWLFLFIFLICAFDSYHMAPVDPKITVFRVIFEVISAFGGCGLSMGHPDVTSSFATVLTVPSKIILILTMCMGRHRGLLDSMKDQEEIEYSAQTLIDSWKQLALLEQLEKRKSLAKRQTRSTIPVITNQSRETKSTVPVVTIETTPQLITKF
ncbi:unnamed protein product [Adineta steineri]|uniref:Uncharacterized protein n=2 Tax=Adineta steineri TaxID=433720 RepID=A0A819EYS1_9BILA|nr:unnamed protein product [Adineta steineri]CAF3856285.1 unnamed protein product [Adineta steineri]